MSPRSNLSKPDMMTAILLLGLAVLLPFELERGFSLGSLVVTPWEVLLLVFFLLSGPRWLARNAKRHPSDLSRNPWTVSMVLAAIYLTVATAAALHSPAPITTVLKPLLRYATSILLLHLTWFELERCPRIRRPLVLALCAGVFTATLLGLAETSLGLNLESVLSPFRGQVTLHEGAPRLTGTFHHANEAAAAIALSLILLWTAFWSAPEDQRESTPLRSGEAPAPTRNQNQWPTLTVIFVAWAVAATLLAVGLVFTLSRAGVLAGLGGWIGLSLYGAGRLTGARRRLLAFSAILVPGLALALSLVASSAVRDRILGSPDHPYAVRYVVPEWIHATTGEDLNVPIDLINTGARTWKPRGPHPFHLSYHVADTDGGLIDFEGARSRLPAPVPSAATVTLDALLRAPRDAGEYTVIWDLVHEEVTWFSQAGSPGAITALTVTTSGSGADSTVSARRPSIPAAAREFAAWDELETVPRSTLWPIALSFWREHPWLGIGPDQFRHRFAEKLPEGRYDPKLHANNLYLELGATSGTLGLVSYLFWIGTLVWILGRRSLRAGKDSLRIWSLGGLGLLGVFLAHGLFDSFLEPWAIQGLLALGLGALLCDSETGQRHKEM